MVPGRSIRAHCPTILAQRIGSISRARRCREALLDPNSPPDILTELAVERRTKPHRRAVTVQGCGCNGRAAASVPRRASPDRRRTEPAETC